MNALALLKGLRFIDSFFPSGGYAFSSGLEAAVQAGQVSNAEEFALYVEDLMQGSISRREAVAVARAWDAQASGAGSEAKKTDLELDAMHLSREVRMASRQMGRQVIRIAGDEPGSSPLLRDFYTMVENRLTPGHFPVCVGLTLGAAGWKREDAVAAFLYQTAVGFVSAGMKVLPLGQREGQRLLSLWASMIAEIAHTVTAEATLCAWSPVQDIFQMRHARLESRLFRS